MSIGLLDEEGEALRVTVNALLMEPLHVLVDWVMQTLHAPNAERTWPAGEPYDVEIVAVHPTTGKRLPMGWMRLTGSMSAPMVAAMVLGPQQALDELCDSHELMLGGGAIGADETGKLQV